MDCSAQTAYLKLNNFKENLQPRLGLTWDFTGKGRRKLFANFARFLEAPIPVMFLFSAGGLATSFSANVDRLNAPARFGGDGRQRWMLRCHTV
jgi:hypothetical protein